MAPRARKHKGLEPNLYQSERKNTTYYRYKHPITGAWHGMGDNKAKANAAARILNAKLLTGGAGLVERVLGIADKTISHLVERFRAERLPELGLAAGTQRNTEYRLNRIEQDLGNRIISTVTTQDCAEWLDNNFERNPYVKHRGTLIDLFRFGVTKGYLQNNPADPTYAQKQDKKARQRMTLEQYKALHAAAPSWLKIAMEIALITLQGRYEVCHMRYDAIRDGALHVVREKTKKNDWARLRIMMTPELEEVVRRSRDDGIVSPYIVHWRPSRIKPSKDTDHWSQFSPNKFGAEFRKVRDTLSVFTCMPKEERPTFHEIRSLGAWLYEQNGYQTNYVQQLMAHGDQAMTKYYQQGHSETWVQVEAGLCINDLIS